MAAKRKIVCNFTSALDLTERPKESSPDTMVEYVENDNLSSSPFSASSLPPSPSLPPTPPPHPTAEAIILKENNSIAKCSITSITVYKHCSRHDHRAFIIQEKSWLFVGCFHFFPWSPVVELWIFRWICYSSSPPPSPHL